MLVDIPKSEIPDWDYGDVCIKTYSVGDQMKLADLAAKIMPGANIDSTTVAINPDFSAEATNIHLLAAGVHFIRSKDNATFFIAPNTQIEIKTKAVYDISHFAGKYLLSRINDLNKPLSEDQKKN